MKRFTLVELLIVIAIVLVLGAILTVAITKAQARGREATCINNLKQIALGIYLYVDEHESRLPVAGRLGPDAILGWRSLPEVLTTVPEPELFACPADRPPDAYFPEFGTSYEWNTFVNGRLLERTNFRIVGLEVRTPLLGDAGPFHGGERRYFLWPDGHVETSLQVLIE